MAALLRSPSFLITFSILQTVVLLFLIRAVAVYEYEPVSALALLMVWGSLGATAMTVGLRTLLDREIPRSVQAAFGPAIGPPIAEEVSKGIALAAALLLSVWMAKRFGTRRLRGVTDGIVYGAAVGLGFAFAEDLHLLVDAAGQPNLVTFLARRDFFGAGVLHHAVFTAAFGVGLGFATWSRRHWLVRTASAIGGLAVAMILHSLNNGLVSFVVALRFGFQKAQALAPGTVRAATPPEFRSTVEFAGHLGGLLAYLVAVAFAALLWWWLRHQARIIRETSAEDVRSGFTDQRDIDLVASPLARLRWYWELVRISEVDRYRVTRRLHAALAELAFIRWQHRKGAAGQDEVDAARQRVANLKAASRIDVYAQPVGT